MHKFRRDTLKANCALDVTGFDRIASEKKITLNNHHTFLLSKIIVAIKCLLRD
jgi:hypothetical protein